MIFLFCILFVLFCILIIVLFYLLHTKTPLDTMTDDKMQEEFISEYKRKNKKSDS